MSKEMIQTSERHPTVLLIDDQPFVAAAVQQRLQGGKFDFHYCQEPANGIKTALALGPTVILLGLNMPEVDGMMVLKFLRGHPVLSETPIIMLSATDDPEVKARAFGLGANDYITKLPDAVELLARVTYNSRAYIDKLGRAEANGKLAEANEALRRRVQSAEELFEQFMAHNPALACIKDSEGRYVYLNQRFRDLIDSPQDDLLGRTDLDLWSPEIAERIRSNDAEFARGDKRLGVIERLAQDSHWRTYRFPLTSHDGKSMLGLVAVDVSEQVRAEGELRRVAYSDVLTGLPNRAHLLSYLQASVTRDEKFAIMFADLDGFKLVNDSYGHEAGDELLQEVAKRLTAHTPAGAFVARLGGDEFTMVLQPENAMEVAEKLHKSLTESIEVKQRGVFVGVSLGVALRSQESVAEMLRNADIAMYSAKDAGKGRTRVYEEGMHRDLVTRLELETDLRHGIDGQQFVNHYQPIVCLRTGDIVGFEALVRWCHPTRGLLLPSSFLGPCERLGLLPSIGRRVIQGACQAVKGWGKAFVSINLSLSQLADPDFESDILRLIEESGVSPNQLKLEVDDSDLTSGAKGSGGLSRLAELPIQLSLNDFATGQSSLNILSSSAFDTVKLNHSMISLLTEREQTQAIARHAVQLALELRIKTVASGVEGKDQLVLLRSMGCDYAQGYLFSEPVAVEQANRLMQTWDPDLWKAP